MSDLQITVRADLFRIAYHAVSTEYTRYYLNGVFVEPHPEGGVTLTSTDGHRLLSVYDREGSASVAAIIKLPSDALKACKPARTDKGRALKIDGGEARIVATDATGTDKPVAIATDLVIDGMFPDWRAVVPKGPFASPAVATFNASYVQGIAGLAKDIASAFDLGSVYFKTLSTTDRDPALILFPGAPEVFAVLMPVRDLTANALPGFAGIKPEAAPTKKRKAAHAPDQKAA